MATAPRTEGNTESAAVEQNKALQKDLAVANLEACYTKTL